MVKGDNMVRDFVYLDWERVRSLAAQLFRGVPEDSTIETEREASLGGEIEGGVLGFLKGKSGTDFRYLRTENETRSLHHYIYSLVEKELIKKKLCTSVGVDFDFKNWAQEKFHDGQFVRITGIVRLTDYGWTTTMMEALPKMMSTVVHMMKLNLQKQRNEKILTTEQLKELQQKVDEQEKVLKNIKDIKVDQLADLIRSLYGDVIRVKVVPNKLHRNKLFVGTGNVTSFYDTTASLVQKYGYEIDADWITLGQINLSNSLNEPLPIPIGNQMEDGFEQVLLMLNNLARIASSPKFPAVSFTPLSIYRTV